MGEEITTKRTGLRAQMGFRSLLLRNRRRIHRKQVVRQTHHLKTHVSMGFETMEDLTHHIRRQAAHQIHHRS